MVNSCLQPSLFYPQGMLRGTYIITLSFVQCFLYSLTDISLNAKLITMQTSTGNVSITFPH